VNACHGLSDVTDDPLVLPTGLQACLQGLVGSTLADVDPHHEAHQNNFLLFRAFARPCPPRDCNCFYHSLVALLLLPRCSMLHTASSL
jgi:hypothetical protein